MESCALCLRGGASTRCSRCKTVWYCDRSCQKRHWSVHKVACGATTSKALTAAPRAKAVAAAPTTVAAAIEAAPTIKVAFLGVARDCGRFLDRSLSQLESLSEKLFGEAAGFVFFENDSEDGTLEILEAFAARAPSRRVVLSESGLDDRFPRRTERIAFARNAGLERVEALGWLATLDFVVVADLDDVNTKVDASGAAAALWHLERGGADAVTASQRGAYYDLWALRTEAFDVNNWALAHRRAVVDRKLEAFFPKGRRPRGYDVPRDQVILDEVRFSERAPPVPVLSAFGGLAIYRAAKLRRTDDPTKLAPARYDGGDAAMVPPVCHPLWTG